MNLLLVCVSNEMNVDDSGVFLQALMDPESDIKLIFSKGVAVSKKEVKNEEQN